MFICIAGKNNIAVDILKYLIENNYDRHEIGVVCNRTENGKNTWQKSLRLFAREHEIKEYSLDEIYRIENMVFLSLEFNQIVKPERFSSARLYNIHFSLLPKYRGMFTSALPILHGEKETGVTLHRIDSGIDTGEIIAQKKFYIRDTDTARDLYFKYIYFGTLLVKENIKMILDGKESSVPQEETEASYYSKHAIDYTNICIELDKRAIDIKNQIRAFNFREYQIPEVYGEKIIDTRITNILSSEKAGMRLFEDNAAIVMASLDYDIILYKDRLDELMTACRKGDLKKVQEISLVKRHVDQQDGDGNTPLIVASQHNNVDIVKCLVVQGADVHIKNYEGKGALECANEVYLRTGDARIKNLLMKFGVKN